MKDVSQVLDEQQQSVVLKLARDAIRTVLQTEKEVEVPPDEFLFHPAGAFVTLKIHGELRGCIGFIEARYPLGETIVKCAISAALHDPRFPPLRIQELPTTHIEVSVLSGLWQIQRPEEIEVGKHGIVISLGHSRGLLLPQVAVEYGWDRLTFLKHTCHKAGLSPDAWQHPSARIELFSAQVFGEPE